MTHVDTVLLDTDVFSLLFLAKNSKEPRSAGWRERLGGRRVLIAFQTRAEILEGALERSWGERRMANTRDALDQTPTIPPDDEVIDAYATLTATCRQNGHPLQDGRHVADRWIAACAIAKRLPLLSGDGIYLNAPNLDLLD